MILTEEEVKALEKLLTCPECGSRKVEISYYEGRYVRGGYYKMCLDCGYCEILEGLKWNEEG